MGSLGNTGLVLTLRRGNERPAAVLPGARPLCVDRRLCRHASQEPPGGARKGGARETETRPLRTPAAQQVLAQRAGEKGTHRFSGSGPFQRALSSQPHCRARSPPRCCSGRRRNPHDLPGSAATAPGPQPTALGQAEEAVPADNRWMDCVWLGGAPSKLTGRSSME